MAAAKTASGVVARGHTVMVDGKPVVAGQKVTLPDSEIQALVEAGFLVDGNAPPIEVSNGPQFVTGGPSVKVV